MELGVRRLREEELWEIAAWVVSRVEARKKKSGRPRKYPLENLIYAALVRMLENRTYRSVACEVEVGTFQNLHAQVKRIPEEIWREVMEMLGVLIRLRASWVSEAVHADGSVKRRLGRMKVKRKRPGAKEKVEVWERKGKKILVVARLVRGALGMEHWEIVDAEVGEKWEADQKLVERAVERSDGWCAKEFRGDANVVTGKGVYVLMKRGIRVRDREGKDWNFEGIFGAAGMKWKPLRERVYVREALFMLLVVMNLRTLSFLTVALTEALFVFVVFIPPGARRHHRGLPKDTLALIFF